jgi:hypothetical protein
MSLSRFIVTRVFHAWSPGDRENPERHICVSPGPKDLFMDEEVRPGTFVKFLKSGSWYEAARDDFEGATVREMMAKMTTSGRHGG